MVHRGRMEGKWTALKKTDSSSTAQPALESRDLGATGRETGRHLYCVANSLQTKPVAGKMMKQFIKGRKARANGLAVAGGSGRGGTRSTTRRRRWLCGKTSRAWMNRLGGRTTSETAGEGRRWSIRRAVPGCFRRRGRKGGLGLPRDDTQGGRCRRPSCRRRNCPRPNCPQRRRRSNSVEY